MIAIGLAEPDKPERPKRSSADVDVEAGDDRNLLESDNLGAQRAHEANFHEMDECPLCGGPHEASVHTDDDE